MSVHRLYECVSTAMSTTVSVQIVGEHPEVERLAADALAWFDVVERSATRFDLSSELMRLGTATDTAVSVSPVLFELLRVALSVARVSGGAFDPTVGARVHQLGFNRPWRGGSAVPLYDVDDHASWRDLELDEGEGTVRCRRPVQLDLGAIAKGFAMDLAMRTLAALPHCAIYAGGDLLYRGLNAKGEPWRTAIVHPRDERAHLAIVTVDAAEYAICTSGDYVRRTVRGHHIVDPARPSATSATASQSVTVVAPQAAIADALATAAFVLGPHEGSALLREQGVDGCLVGADGTCVTVAGWGTSTWALGHD